MRKRKLIITGLNSLIFVTNCLLFVSCNNFQNYDYLLNNSFWYEEIEPGQFLSIKYNRTDYIYTKGDQIDSSKIMLWHFSQNKDFEFCGINENGILCPNDQKIIKSKLKKDGFKNDLEFKIKGWRLKNKELNIRDLVYDVKSISDSLIILKPKDSMLELNKIPTIRLRKFQPLNQTK
ncbi:MAG: hypothetical protein IPP61_01360 [Cytophagaceae bacterium]|nr:hypothetical protein [Cytophagaceae bacterium]MBL0323826.1 hypothetical protein [Cytophagaceae bacterium]